MQRVFLTMLRIYVIATGGTIEKVYSEQTGNVQNLDSKIDRYFRMLRLPDAEIAVTHLMNKDSLEMTDADRERVLANRAREAGGGACAGGHHARNRHDGRNRVAAPKESARAALSHRIDGRDDAAGIRGQRRIAKPDREPARGARAAARACTW